MRQITHIILPAFVAMLVVIGCSDDTKTTGNNGPTNNDPTNNDPTNNDPTNNDPTNNDPTNNDPTNNDPTNNGPTNNGPTPLMMCQSACDHLADACPDAFRAQGCPDAAIAQLGAVCRGACEDTAAQGQIIAAGALDCETVAPIAINAFEQLAAVCVTCTDACTAGATQCNADGDIETCAEAAEGCLAFAVTADCGATQHCDAANGTPACIDDCTDVCTDGVTQCNADGDIETCAEAADGCLAFAVTTDCGAAQHCDAANGTPACIDNCTDACTDGATQCNADGDIETCADAVDGCLAFAVTTDCGAAQHCDAANGTPACIDNCTDACTAGATQCNANGGVETCGAAASGCLDWSLTDACDGARQSCTVTNAVASCGCDDTCMAGGSRCNADSTATEVCAADADGCFAFVAGTTCENGTVCQETNGATCELPVETCDDVQDNDGDGIIDCADQDCAMDPFCLNATGTCADAIGLLNSGLYEGSNFHAPDNLAPSCAGEGSGEVVYAAAVDAAVELCFDTVGSRFDTALYILEGGCDGPEVACADDINSGIVQQSQINLTLEPGSTYYVVVDGYEVGIEGSYVLNVYQGPCVVPATPELCGSGADEDGDGDFDCADSDCANTILCNNFRLRSVDQGPDRCLESNQFDDAFGLGHNGASFMDICQAVSGQTWSATLADSLWIRLHSEFQGPGKCLESNDPDAGGSAFMGDCGVVSGQFWQFVPDEMGYYTLHSLFQGPDKCLDSNAPESVEFGGAAHMADCQGDPAQLWEVVPNIPNTCLAPLPIREFGTQTSDSTNAARVETGSCNGAGPEEVWLFGVDAPTTLCLDTIGSTIDTVLYVRTGTCGEGTEIGCNDDIALGELQSRLTVDAVPGEFYYVFVDSFQSGGAYNLNVNLGPCGP